MRACRVIGYLRVSTAEQRDVGAGLDAQKAAIAAEAKRRDWHVDQWTQDAAASGKSMERRPGLAAAIAAVETGGASILVVSKLDRLSRSVVDFATLLERSRSKGWGLVALDLGVDTTTPAGELVANVMAAVAQWERRAIGQRTKEGLAVRRAAGVRLGREPQVSPEALRRIRLMREQEMTFAAIAEELNSVGEVTAHGGSKWWPSTVRGVLNSQHALRSATPQPGSDGTHG